MTFKHLCGGIVGLMGALVLSAHAGVITLEKEGGYVSEGRLRGFDLSGQYAYMALDTKGIEILDITSSQLPKTVAEYRYGSGRVYNIVVEGDIAYLAYDKVGLVILDISDPAHPVLIGRYDTAGRLKDLVIHKGYAYLADRKNGLVVVNVNDPAHPVKVARINTGKAIDVTASGDYVYVANANKGVLVFDVSDPSKPVKKAEIATHEKARGIVYHNDFLYVADQGAGLVIIDVHDKTHPVEKAHLLTGGRALNVSISGKYVFIADFKHGITIIDISDPTHPVKAENYPGIYKVREVRLKNGYVYAAGLDSGLSILKFTEEEVQNTEAGKVQNEQVRMARMVQEYHLVNSLVDRGITNETVDSGAWNDTATWKDGRIPEDGARVRINPYHKITINNELTTKVRTIELKGELAFNPHKNTRLIVDTMVTESGSILRIGEPGIPVDMNKTATIMIHDYQDEGMIINDTQSIDYDPLRIGQGILTNGLFFTHGAYKTPYVEISGKGVARGSVTVAFEEEPEGWRAGDEVVILGTSEAGTESEHRTITAIEEGEVTLDKALDFDHFVPDTTIENLELKVHMANITRNIVIKTDPASISGRGDKNDPDNVEHRGHVLFMHNNNVNINSVQFEDLGRTNKKYVLNETKFTSEDIDAEATHIGTNQAARYPVHFHRAGIDGKLGRINDCVVLGSPGWGYVNHSSNVAMRENIAYGVYGAAFITEAGDENGKFIGNMAIQTRGYGRSSVKGWKARRNEDDWGFGGNGFWLLGPNVDVVDNIVNGSSNSAFAFTRVTIDSVTGVITPEKNLELPYGKVPLKSFVGNIAYGNSGGVFGILSGTRQGTTETIKGLLAYANGALSHSKENPDAAEWISWWYPSNIVLEDVTLIGDIHHPKYTGIGTQTKLRKTTIKNARIEGMQIGIRIPEYVGPNVVEGGYYNNVTNMLYYLGTTNHGANTTIKGNIVFGDLPGESVQTKVKFGLRVRDIDYKNYQKRQYNTFNILYKIEGETALKLYATQEQSPDFEIKVGSNKGKTNQELVDDGKKPVGGVLLPENAFTVEGMENVSAVEIQ